MIQHRKRNYKKGFLPYRLLPGDVLLTSPCYIYQRGEVVQKDCHSHHGVILSFLENNEKLIWHDRKVMI